MSESEGIAVDESPVPGVFGVAVGFHPDEMDEVQGFILGNWGMAEVGGCGWSVTYIPNGKALQQCIKSEAAAVGLMTRIYYLVGDTDLTDEETYWKIFPRMKTLVLEWLAEYTKGIS